MSSPATATGFPVVDPSVHAAWLPDAALAPLGSRRVAVVVPDGGAPDVVAQTVRDEVAAATAAHGGAVVDPQQAGTADVVLAVRASTGAPAGAPAGSAAADPEAFTLTRALGMVTVTATTSHGLLHGLFHLVRLGEHAFTDPDGTWTHAPTTALRMLDHWDNVAVHPVMGQVERGYSGGSIFYDDGQVRADLTRVAQYSRLLAASGINRVAINNVNVGPRESLLLTDDLDEVARIAAAFRPYGIRTHLSVSWASPVRLGGLTTSDPLDEDVRAWWRAAADRVWATIPDFGGFVVKADSEGQPGPFAYGRSHADGANMLAAAVAPHGGLVHWRAFVYDHTQDWRDRKTDRARAAYDHFAPHDGEFADNVIVQIKHGPLDFQVREAVSPAIAALPRTRLAAEFQVTTEYLGHQKHAVYLGRMWSELLRFPYWGEGSATMADVAAGRHPESDGTGGDGTRAGGFAAVSNVGDDVFWTGHPFAQANLYAWGRLTWDPTLDPIGILDEWVSLTFPGADPRVRETVHAVLDESWETYERYTAPLGVCFMVKPHTHYGPDPDGYEYSPWGTYHFADRDGVGVDRTRATGTGFTGQYPAPWRDVYESLETVPDELLLFFHHVPYGHVLRSGKTVIQHVYDTHFEGLERVHAAVEAWQAAADAFPPDVAERVTERFAEQVRSATDWRDVVNTYFFRKSGIPDAAGRTIY
ncbi:alpha-glucuronidase [Xylanimonas oleitrophica]|uniref:Alpha-glucuronidase n=1 Tax=Xylanimonas oleitrophica TaxID=2607479 RepID=A0A2W5WNR1_9MICO|nr:alpha-glucuronidase [Xylanimonas oleitrophica]PZR52622.1 alpha-glucuronidase [Xylanimonas oleitrophica]